MSRHGERKTKRQKEVRLTNMLISTNLISCQVPGCFRMKLHSLCGTVVSVSMCSGRRAHWLGDSMKHCVLSV
jgi:hypothetical protein